MNTVPQYATRHVMYVVYETFLKNSDENRAKLANDILGVKEIIWSTLWWHNSDANIYRHLIYNKMSIRRKMDSLTDWVYCMDDV